MSLESKHGRQTNKQTGGGKAGGWKSGKEALFSEDVSDCLAGRPAHWTGGTMWTGREVQNGASLGQRA